ncbi:MAG: DUF4926 domain-containing protein [Hyphomicrobiaceae bacterium]|nr:DUF4926 domain-containing protein [Hyphomicrobiaceae bacterium]
MIAEHDQVVLTRDFPEHELVAGDIATTIAIYQGGEGYTLECSTLNGETVAILTVHAADVRSARQGELPHVRAAE